MKFEAVGELLSEVQGLLSGGQACGLIGQHAWHGEASTGIW